MSIVGIDPNIDYDDIIDERDEMEIGPDLQTPDYAHFLLGFVRDPAWVPAWRRNRGPRAQKDLNDPPYDPDYDPRSLFLRPRQIEKQPEFNFPIEQLPQKEKEMEALKGKPIPLTAEMVQRWEKKYGPRWKEAVPWLYAYEREDPNPPEDKRSNWQKRNDEYELKRAKNFRDFFVERVKMVNSSKKKLQEDLKHEEINEEEVSQLLEKHVLPPIKEEELIQRGIMDKQDSYEDENTVFFPWKRKSQVLAGLQKEFDAALFRHKKDQLITGPVSTAPYGEFSTNPYNPYPAVSEELLHEKCGRHVNGLKLCKIMAQSRLNAVQNSCQEAAVDLISCMQHQFCRNETWMVHNECTENFGRSGTRLCELAQERQMACLAKSIPPHSNIEL